MMYRDCYFCEDGSGPHCSYCGTCEHSNSEHWQKLDPRSDYP